MSDKAERKKKLIRETAREVFIRKGFKDVTMKDIAQTAGISRGGLYLYYSSTEELLLDVLRIESAESDDTFETAISRRAAAADILLLFLNEQKKELLNQQDALSVATYEYAFSTGPGESGFLRKRFQSAVRIIEHLIRAGIQNDEFYSPDPHAAATNIMFVIEGLKVSAQTIGITEKEVDQEICYLMDGLARF